MSETTTPLVCPKCAGELRSYERNGVTIEQCGDCRGIFLDRGELDRLIDAESASLPQDPAAGSQQSGSDEPRYDQPSRAGHHGGGKHGGGHGGYEGGRRKRGFLGELFD